MELDKNLPDMILQDEDTHAEQAKTCLLSRLFRNMFILNMPQPLVTWAMSETMLY